jgi:hypothetical protein
MRIIVGPTMAKQGVINYLQRTTIDRNRMYLFCLLPKNENEEQE